MTAGVHSGIASRSPEASLRPARDRQPAAASVAESIDPGPVVVPETARFEGLLTFRGRAQVQGEVTGEILCRGSLRVGEPGHVKGTVEADEVVVAGVIEGDVVARDRIELAATARVTGTLRSPRIHMEDGSLLEGRCETGPLPAAGEVATDPAGGS
jgi:cytoskeletal protein CcmA (bactofilin family)